MSRVTLYTAVEGEARSISFLDCFFAALIAMTGYGNSAIQCYVVLNECEGSLFRRFFGVNTPQNDGFALCITFCVIASECEAIQVTYLCFILIIY